MRSTSGLSPADFCSTALGPVHAIRPDVELAEDFYLAVRTVIRRLVPTLELPPVPLVTTDGDRLYGPGKAIGLGRRKEFLHCGRRLCRDQAGNDNCVWQDMFACNQMTSRRAATKLRNQSRCAHN